jgi:SNF2 family DNA or RNA helicase
VIAHLRTIPENEKIIIYSFFKGPLDLMEGVMTYDLGIGCARFDGDVVPEARNADLDRFKSDPSCRVLLATVQSGGTGLNIVEANNVIFFDRWFNPCVHAQAQDRYCIRSSLYDS